jgi:hypothetical protein
VGQENKTLLLPLFFVSSTFLQKSSGVSTNPIARPKTQPTHIFLGPRGILCEIGTSAFYILNREDCEDRKESFFLIKLLSN